MRGASDSATPWRVVVGVVASARWVLIPLLALNSVLLVFATIVGGGWLLGTAVSLVAHSTVGLIGSYAVHEIGHALALRALPGVDRVEVESRALRFSLVPIGRMTGWQMAIGALAGPLLAVAVGGLLALSVSATGLQYWFLGQAVFLVPVFGDGRALIRGVTLRSRTGPVGAG